MNQGWECPKCGKVYAPSIIQCLTCGKNTYPTPPYPQPYPITYYYPTVYSGTAWTSTKWILSNKPDDPDSGVSATVTS